MSCDLHHSAQPFRLRIRRDSRESPEVVAAVEKPDLFLHGVVVAVVVVVVIFIVVDDNQFNV